MAKLAAEPPLCRLSVRASEIARQCALTVPDSSDQGSALRRCLARQWEDRSKVLVHDEIPELQTARSSHGRCWSHQRCVCNQAGKKALQMELAIRSTLGRIFSGDVTAKDEAKEANSVVEVCAQDDEGVNRWWLHLSHVVWSQVPNPVCGELRPEEVSDDRVRLRPRVSNKGTPSLMSFTDVATHLLQHFNTAELHVTLSVYELWNASLVVATAQPSEVVVHRPATFSDCQAWPPIRPTAVRSMPGGAAARKAQKSSPEEWGWDKKKSDTEEVEEEEEEQEDQELLLWDVLESDEFEEVKVKHIGEHLAVPETEALPEEVIPL